MTTWRTNIALWHYYVAINDDTLTVLKRNNFKFCRKFFDDDFLKIYIFFKDLFGAISIVSIAYRRDKIIFDIYEYSRNSIIWKNWKIKLIKNFFTINRIKSFCLIITILFTFVNIWKQYMKFILEVNTMNIFLCYRSECHSVIRDSLRWRLIFTERRIFNDLKSIVVRIPCVISVDSEVGHERRSNLKWLWWNGIIWWYFFMKPLKY